MSCSCGSGVNLPKLWFLLCVFSWVSSVVFSNPIVRLRVSLRVLAIFMCCNCFASCLRSACPGTEMLVCSVFLLLHFLLHFLCKYLLWKGISWMTYARRAGLQSAVWWLFDDCPLSRVSAQTSMIMTSLSTCYYYDYDYDYYYFLAPSLAPKLKEKEGALFNTFLAAKNSSAAARFSPRHGKWVPVFFVYFIFGVQAKNALNCKSLELRLELGRTLINSLLSAGRHPLS